MLRSGPCSRRTAEISQYVDWKCWLLLRSPAVCREFLNRNTAAMIAASPLVAIPKSRMRIYFLPRQNLQGKVPNSPNSKAGGKV